MNDLTEDIDIRKTLRKGIGDAKAAKMQRQARGVKGLLDELKNEKMNVLMC